jgi:hypothetical protein
MPVGQAGAPQAGAAGKSAELADVDAAYNGYTSLNL